MDSKVTLLASGIILAGGALVAAPWVLGQKIEKDFRAGIEEAATAAVGAPVKLKLVSYERGFWNSTARTRLEILPDAQPEEGEDGEKPAPPPVLNLEHRIAHGLGPAGLRYARITTDLVLDNPKNSAVARFFRGASPLTVTLDLGLDRSGSGTIRSPAAKQTLKEDDSEIALAWNGMNGTYAYDLKAGTGSFDVAAPSFKADAEMGKAELRGLEFKGAMHRSAESGLWLGMSSMQLASAQAEMLGKGFSLDGLSMVGDSTEAAGLVKSSFAWRSKRMAVGEDVVSDFAFKLTASNLDAKALKALDDAMSQPGAGDETAQAALATQAIMAQLPAILAKKPRLTIDEGKLSFNGAAMELAGQLSYVGNPAITFQPMTDIEGHAKVTLPRELLVGGLRKRLEKEAQMKALASDEPVDVAALVEEGSTQMIDALVAQGMLVAADNGRYRSEIKLQKGAITVNGAPFQGFPGAGDTETSGLGEEEMAMESEMEAE